MPASSLAAANSLIDWFRAVNSYAVNSCIVAFSGGVDSTVVAKAAVLALGDKNAIAVMAISATSTDTELERARSVAAAIPIRFESFVSAEMADECFRVNDLERCYFCKRIRFRAIRDFATKNGVATIVDGSNADDLDDFRPGRKAALEWGLKSPLAELGFDKKTVRALAQHWNLPNSELPAAPCLATRIAYGLEITEKRLRKIEAAEKVLHELGFSPLRVRLHSDDLVRIEVAEEVISRLSESSIRRQVLDAFMPLGLRHVSVDLGGFRSGNMNDAPKRSGLPEE